jgi:hypothetical protein
MLSEIPKDKYKSVKIGKQVEVTGYKSGTYEYPDGFNKPSKLNNELVSLTIATGYDSSSDFKFRIHGRKDLLKLKEAIDFALEIDDV